MTERGTPLDEAIAILEAFTPEQQAAMTAEVQRQFAPIVEAMAGQQNAHLLTYVARLEVILMKILKADGMYFHFDKDSVTLDGWARVDEDELTILKALAAYTEPTNESEANARTI